MKRLKKILRGLVKAFFPEGIKCNCCGDELPREMKYSFCGKCFGKLIFCGDSICKKCGSYTEDLSDFCQTCKRAERPFDMGRGVLYYTGDAARLIKAYKSGDKFLAPYFAEMMYDHYAANLSNERLDAVCFVPCGRKRLKERGYNQSAELARLFCEKAELPLYDCLRQIKPTRKQATLSAAERAENIQGAYAVCCRTGYCRTDSKVAEDRKAAESKADADHDCFDVKGKRIMLIDDIFTTGCTAGECARVLKKAGANYVLVFTLATGKGK